jgi:hypothetical protein
VTFDGKFRQCHLKIQTSLSNCGAYKYSCKNYSLHKSNKWVVAILARAVPDLEL